MAAIEIEGLTKVYVRDFLDIEHGRLKFRLKNRRTVALEGLTMQVERGEIFGLLGPNGAGKTTTIKILMGIHFATSGTARILGAPLGDRSIKARIGFLPENPYFYDYLTGREFLNFYGQLYGIPRKRRREKIEELLELVGLPPHAHDLPLRGYSKGMNQRIGLAQCLLNDPDIVVLDEPQSGLDPLGRKDVRDIIVGLREAGKTVFFSSHILQDAELICDRVAILLRGRLKAMGHMNELLSRRVNEWEIQFSGAPTETVEAWAPRLKKLIRSQEEFLAIATEEDLAREIIRTVVEKGGTLLQVTPRRQTLEDYFLAEVAAGGDA